MTPLRVIRLIATLSVASTLVACNITPSMPMGSAAAQGMGGAGPMSQAGQTGNMDMGKMDAQMKKMREMHGKMTAAKTPEERSKLMADHMRTMQESMQLMGSMSGMHGGAAAGMPATPDTANAANAKPMPGMASGMGTGQQLMEKRLAMMESMMQMMMDRMPAAPAR